MHCHMSGIAHGLIDKDLGRYAAASWVVRHPRDLLRPPT